MPAFTVRYRPLASPQQCTALENFARRSGAAVSWMHARAQDRSYALVDGASAQAAIERDGGILPASKDEVTVFETPVIALAIRPNVAEALPALEQALFGPGRPAGVVGSEIIGEQAIVEWDMDVTPAHVVLALIDVELDRFHASRVTELLTPLPLAWWTALAASGLQAPEIAPDRVLEALIEERHVAT